MTVTQDRKNKEDQMNKITEDTQGLINKDLLLDFPEDKDKPLTSECPNCKTTFEYYPEDPNPVGEEGWCYTCVFGVDDYDE